MTFAVLRALHGIIGEALDDIEGVYNSHGQEALSDPVAAVGVDAGDKDYELRRGSSSSSTSHAKAPACFNATGASATGKSPGYRHKSTLSNSSLNAICKAYVSPPPSPCVATKEQRFDQRVPSVPSTHPAGSQSAHTSLDFPSLDAPYDPGSASETLTAHPTVMAAMNRIISACGQMSATVQTPFLSICDSTMGVSPPICLPN